MLQRLSQILLLLTFFGAFLRPVLAAYFSDQYNYHEHFTTAASYDDYVNAFELIGQPLSVQKMSSLSENPRGSIRDIFGEEVARRLPAPERQDIGNLTFMEVARLIAPWVRTDPVTVMRSFFEFSPYNRHDPESLEAIGWDIRSGVQKILTDRPGGLVLLFDPYLSRLEQGVHKVLSLSISARTFFSESSNGELSRLSSFMKYKHDTTLEAFVVLQRYRLIHWADQEFNEFVAKLEHLITRKEGLRIDGLDLVGSLHEDKAENLKLSHSEKVQLKARLGRLLNILSSPQGGPYQFRMHAWEVPNAADGDFYRVFWDLVADAAQGKGDLRFPALFRIGHISGVREVDLMRFQWARKHIPTNFVFEANVVSNASVFSSSMDSLVDTLIRIDEANFPVLLGSDSHGIFGEAAGMRKIVRMIQRSGIPPRTMQWIAKDMGELAQLKQRSSAPHRPADLFSYRFRSVNEWPVARVYPANSDAGCELMFIF